MHTNVIDVGGTLVRVIKHETIGGHTTLQIYVPPQTDQGCYVPPQFVDLYLSGTQIDDICKALKHGR